MLQNQSEEQLVIFEALGNTGVGFCSWAAFVKHKWYKGYPKLGWRSLNCERDAETLAKMYDFIVVRSRF